MSGWLIPAMATGLAVLFVAGQTTRRHASPYLARVPRPHTRMHDDADPFSPTAVAHVAPGPGSMASIAAAPELTDDDLRRERALGDEARLLDQARAELAPLLVECDMALRRAVLDMRAATHNACAGADLWHRRYSEACEVCHPRVLPTSAIVEALLAS